MSNDDNDRYVVMIMSRRLEGVTHFYVVDRQRDDMPVATFPVNTFDRVTEKTTRNSEAFQRAMARKVCDALNAIEEATNAALHNTAI